MMEYIKIVISAVTLVFLSLGFILTIDQVQSGNNISLMHNLSQVFATTHAETIDNVTRIRVSGGRGLAERW
ncbi:MAG: hypothetical protein OXQ84_05945 [bacterium]|nr:hypothetical protein [bacterium]